MLMEHSFKEAIRLGYDVIVIFGSPVNYVSRGFKSCKKWIYQESDIMAVSEEQAQNYDNTLEKLEKKYQPSQDEFYIMSHSFIEG